jgi:MYXO-CTERM domain-containing protein
MRNADVDERLAFNITTYNFTDPGPNVPSPGPIAALGVLALGAARRRR